MRRVIIKIYVWLRRHAFGGRGLSRVRFFRELNFRLEKALKGKKLSKINRNGLTIWLDPRESVVGKLEEFRPKSTALLAQYLKPGDVFVDVGASIGWFSLMAASIVGKTGKVYAFEPEPRSFSLLQKNTETNGFSEIISLVHAAVAERGGKAKLYVVGDALTWANLDDPRKNYKSMVEANFGKHEDKTIYEHEVSVVSLDETLPRGADFIKIDVAVGGTAAENVVRGMMKIIKKRNPGPKIIITLPNKNTIDLLRQHGYAARTISDNHVFFEPS